MSTATKIEWTEATWNPTTGCDRVSEGCDHCYAATIAGRLWPTQYPPNADGSPRHFEDVRLHPDRLDLPLRWRKPRRIFVDSMSDLFHNDVPDEFVARVWAVMYEAHWHTFQVLTKRPGRMASLVGRSEFIEMVQRAAEAMHDDPDDIYVQQGPWPPKNVWLGTSVESQKWAGVRIPQLLRTPAAVRFLSCEPLLGPVDLRPWIHHAFDGDGSLYGGQDLYERCAVCGDQLGASNLHTETHDGRPVGIRGRPFRSIDWVIAGGESGPGFRPLDLDWARSLRDQCVRAGVPFFFKQVGGRTPKAGGRELDGRTWDELPEGRRRGGPS